MTEPSAAPRGVHVSGIIEAAHETVYRACLDPNVLVRWRVPDTMTGRLGFFEPREGGSYRMSLIDQDRGHSLGGTSEDTDMFRRRFIELIACEKIVELVEFVSLDPRFRGRDQEHDVVGRRRRRHRDRDDFRRAARGYSRRGERNRYRAVVAEAG
ncbi:MAG TPA: SRPBCC domain-containing protein [Lichenihabitans sp.]|nr:SRPBCC domain-containing protein [Lichenihabitans sp.]